MVRLLPCAPGLHAINVRGECEFGRDHKGSVARIGVTDLALSRRAARLLEQIDGSVQLLAHTNSLRVVRANGGGDRAIKKGMMTVLRPGDMIQFIHKGTQDPPTWRVEETSDGTPPPLLAPLPAERRRSVSPPPRDERRAGALASHSGQKRLRVSPPPRGESSGAALARHATDGKASHAAADPAGDVILALRVAERACADLVRQREQLTPSLREKADALRRAIREALAAPSLPTPPAGHPSLLIPPAGHPSLPTPPADHPTLPIPPTAHPSLPVPPTARPSLGTPPAKHLFHPSSLADHPSRRTTPADHASVRTPPADHPSVRMPSASLPAFPTPPAAAGAAGCSQRSESTDQLEDRVGASLFASGTGGKWVECDRCGMWRPLPRGARCPSAWKAWRCEMHTDKRYNRCSRSAVPVPIGSRHQAELPLTPPGDTIAADSPDSPANVLLVSNDPNGPIRDSQTSPSFEDMFGPSSLLNSSPSFEDMFAPSSLFNSSPSFEEM
ncbi:hypothetical protein AB1Y20_001688 [Prymnesium parvum]|uniref:CW-type domain-containing protein n=1 Tax=Prymnesium parvum TaxID=97485 RepID=A0AB34KC35_PRYPA